jgi:hypothetical protein
MTCDSTERAGNTYTDGRVAAMLQVSLPDTACVSRNLVRFHYRRRRRKDTGKNEERRTKNGKKGDIKRKGKNKDT